MSEIESLPDELESLLAAERARPDPATELRTRLWTGIATGLGTLPPAGVGRVGPGHGALKAAAVKVSLGKAVVIGAVAFGIGAGSGVLVDRQLRNVPPAAVEVAPPPVPALPDVPQVAPVPVPRPRPVQPHAPPKVTESHDGALAAERAFLERARTALARGRPAEAYQATLEHELDYPHGQLAEERQVLEIQSLVALGRRTEAEKIAAAFRVSHPRSLLLPAVDEALGDGK